jgi:hypothetical protein
VSTAPGQLNFWRAAAGALAWFERRETARSRKAAMRARNARMIRLAIEGRPEDGAGANEDNLPRKTLQGRIAEAGIPRPEKWEPELEDPR